MSLTWNSTFSNRHEKEAIFCLKKNFFVAQTDRLTRPVIASDLEQISFCSLTAGSSSMAEEKEAVDQQVDDRWPLNEVDFKCWNKLWIEQRESKLIITSKT